MKIKICCGGNARLALTVFAVASWASRAEATTIPLTDATPGVTNTYSYTTTNSLDPNATYTGDVQPDGAGNYSMNGSTVGTMSYTFDLGPHASNLNLTGASLFANLFPDSSFATAAINGVSADYTLSGGNSGSGNLFSILTSSNPAGTVVVTPFNENIPLTPANSDTFATVTFTSTALGGNAFQEQLLRSPQAFVATASFVPEPSSVVLFTLGGLGLFAAARRRRQAAERSL